ncbi:MAG TPA: DUF4346 domain-containing protein [Thermoplasmatales archaeon]|nr:DUF4346 domain-containing protein [Thermoplasmatales archaeon]
MVENDIPIIVAEKTPQKEVVLDPKGFFVIEVVDGMIRVEYYTNVVKNSRIVSGKLEKIFTGVKADAICDTIARHIKDLLPEHYMYLGRELLKAQQALENNRKYIQDGC